MQFDHFVRVLAESRRGLALALVSVLRQAEGRHFLCQRSEFGNVLRGGCGCFDVAAVGGAKHDWRLNFLDLFSTALLLHLNFNLVNADRRLEELTLSEGLLLNKLPSRGHGCLDFELLHVDGLLELLNALVRELLLLFHCLVLDAHEFLDHLRWEIPVAF